MAETIEHKISGLVATGAFRADRRLDFYASGPGDGASLSSARICATD